MAGHALYAKAFSDILRHPTYINTPHFVIKMMPQLENDGNGLMWKVYLQPNLFLLIFSHHGLINTTIAVGTKEILPSDIFQALASAYPITGHSRRLW